MFEDLWNGILELTAKFVIPDWSSVVAMLPVLIFAASVVVIVATLWKLLRAPKPRRGKQRIEPIPPPGVHMPGPSWAPVFAAIGAFMLFLGLVFGGAVLILGAIGFALTLLYWLAESLRLYDRDLGATAPPLPAVVHDGPPRGCPHAGPVVPARPGRDRAGDAAARPRLRGVAPGGRCHRVHPVAARLDVGGAPGVRQDRRGRHDRPPRDDAGSADTEVAADLAGRAARCRLRDPGRLDPAARQRW